jgi:RluA family pseudouridine synthase
MSAETPTILFSDDSLLVVNKLAGMLSIKDGYDQGLPYVGSILEPSFGRLWVVHRLDKETSGVMVLARSAQAHARLNQQFAEQQVTKRYHALIAGNPDWQTRRIDLPLRSNVGRRKRTAVDYATGKQAITRLQVCARYPGYTLLEARPETGRTHQIRAHLYAVGFAILSDRLYGVGDISPLIGRLALHAQSLTFQHPLTGQEICFEAPYPADFQQAMSQLRQMAHATRDSGC